MKKMRLFTLAMLGGILLTFSSCKKEEEALTDEETADLVESSTKSSDGGVTEEISTSAEVAMAYFDQYQYDCSFTGDTTITLSKTTSTSSYDLTSNINWEVGCTNFQAYSITFGFTKTSSYDGPKLDRQGTASGSITFTQLDDSYTYYLASGSMSTSGSATFVGAKTSKETETTMTVTLTDLNIDKITYEIVSGTMSVGVYASSDGSSVNKTATVVIANGTGTITINGVDYTFSLY